MREEKKVLVEMLLNSAGRTSAEMSQDLKLLGDGYMPNGLTALWNAGQRSGIVKGVTYTTAVWGLGVATYILIKNRMQDARVAKQLAFYGQTDEGVPTFETTKMEDESAIAENEAGEKGTVNENG